jgi:hypothetical protein
VFVALALLVAASVYISKLRVNLAALGIGVVRWHPRVVALLAP